MSEGLHEIVRYQVPGYISICYFILLLLPLIKTEYIQSIPILTLILSLLSSLFLGIPLGFMLYQIYDYGLMDKILIKLRIRKMDVKPYYHTINKVKDDVRKEFLNKTDDYSLELRNRFNKQLLEDELMNPNVIYDTIHRFYGEPYDAIIAYVRRHKTFYDARGVSSVYSFLLAIYLFIPTILYLRFYGSPILIDSNDVVGVNIYQTVAKLFFCYFSIILLFYVLWRPRKRILQAWDIFITYAMRKYEPDIRKLLLHILARKALDLSYERDAGILLLEKANTLYYSGQYEECVKILQTL